MWKGGPPSSWVPFENSSEEGKTTRENSSKNPNTPGRQHWKVLRLWSSIASQNLDELWPHWRRTQRQQLRWWALGKWTHCANYHVYRTVNPRHAEEGSSEGLTGRGLHKVLNKPNLGGEPGDPLYPHQPTDCTIEIIPGAKLPKPKFYSMTPESYNSCTNL